MKNIFKNLTLYILALALSLSLSACQNAEKAEVINKEEEARLAKFPPVPEGPDEKGLFPSLDSCLVEEEVFSKKGIPDTKKPEDEIKPFEEDVYAKKYLENMFPEIHDWKVIFEDHDYSMRKDTYDPYSYSIRDMYLPSSVVVLDTEESSEFSRLVLCYFDTYHLSSSSGRFVPVYSRSTACYYSDKNDWDNESFDSTLVLTSEVDISGLWFKNEEKAVIFPGAGEEVIFLNDVKEEPPAFFTCDEVKYRLPLYENGDRDYFVVTLGGSKISKGLLMLYNSSERSLYPFEEINNSYIIPLGESSFAINNKDSLCIFDLSSKNFQKPVEVIKDLQGDGMEIFAVTTDRENKESHAMCYRDKNMHWYAAAFDTKGNIKSNYPLSINMSYLYDYEFNFADDILYIDNRILDDNFRFASNTLPENDHECMLVSIRREKDRPASKYIKPLYYPLVADKPFSDVKDITYWPQIAERIYDMTETGEREHYLTKFPGGRMPFDTMMSYIDLLFDVDEEDVYRNSKGYMEEGNIIKYEPDRDRIPPSVRFAGDTGDAVKWEGEEGYIVFGILDEETRELSKERTYRVTVKKDASSPFSFKIISMEKI